MEIQLILSSRFEGGFASVVLVNGIAVAFCHYHADALVLAKYYRGLSSRPCVEVVKAVVKLGKVFKK